MALIAVFVGGGLGAISRYGISLWARRLFPMSIIPWGTFAVNVLGCFLLGFLATFFMGRIELSPTLKVGVTTGFLGGLTTFSTFGYESISLITGGATMMGITNVVGNVVVGLLAALGGIWLAGRI